MEYIALNGGACCDCTIAIANDDYTGMDDATESRVRAGIASFGEYAGHLVIGNNLGFSHQLCAVCRGLAGDRHEVGYLSSGEHRGGSHRELGEFRVIDTRDGSEYGAYLNGEGIR